MTQISFSIDSKHIWRTVFALVALQIAFVIGDILFNYMDVCGHLQIRRLFNIAKEGSIPSWFAVIQMFVLSLLCFFAAFSKKMNSGQQGVSYGWLFLALFFLFMSADDGSQIHERLGSLVSNLRESGQASLFSFIDDFPSYTWQILLGPLFAAGGGFILLFLWKAFPTPRLRLAVVLSLFFWALAVFIDFLEGVSGSLAFLEEALNVRPYFVNHFAKVLEECLEMLGTTFLVAASLFHIRNHEFEM